VSDKNTTQPEQKLILDADELGHALDAMREGVWSWHAPTGKVYYSDRWIQSLGYQREEVESNNGFALGITHPDDRAALVEAGRAHLDGKTDYFECEIRLRKENGEYRWTLGRGRVLERDAAGNPVRIVGANFDITATKQAEIALEAAEQRCRAIVETAGSVILCLAPDTQILEWNAEAERVYGWTAAEVVGKNYAAWFLPESIRQDVVDEIQRVLAGATTRDYENPIITRDGSERILLWNSTRLVNSEGKAWGVVGVGQDITERKLIERQRENAYRETQIMVERFQALRGLLPVCSSCKMIRDQNGNWSSVDEYLEASVDAEISHGLCPACLLVLRSETPPFDSENG